MLVLLIAVAGVRASWLGAAYFAGLADVRRHHVETAWLIYAVVLLGAAVFWNTRRADTVPALPVAAPARWWIAPALVACSMVLYWPALRVGLLSDDFVLLARAAETKFLDRDWIYVRPVPLLIWSGVTAMLPDAAVPATLHVVNVVLHGVNAALVFALVRRLAVESDAAALTAAVMFLTFPLNVEAVVWCAGVFDVLLTTVLLAAVLIALGPPTSRRTGALVALTITALLTKETGVITPGVLALAAFHHGRNRAAWVPVGAAGLITLLYLMVRAIAYGPPPVVLPASGYELKEMLTRPFAALAIPLHEFVITRAPLVPIVMAALWPGVLGLMAVRWKRSKGTTWQDIGLLAGVLLSTLPLMTLLYVGTDLQGARYLYFAASLAAVLLARTLWSAPIPGGRYAAAAAAVTMIAVGGVVTRLHVKPWIQAAVVRDRTIGSALEGGGRCEELAIAGVPDVVDGAYVFRNGFEEACRAAAGTTARAYPPR